MAAAPIDYDALARQHGAIDYDALAAQHGAKNIQPQQPQSGFLGSFADSSGLSTLGHALLHPVDAVQGIPAAVSGIVKNTTDNVKQGIEDYQKSGLSEQTRRDFGRAVPVIGPTLATAQAQHDAGNNAGMAGTLAGTVLGAAVPQKLAGLAAEGAGKIAALGSTSPESLKLAATRVLAPGDPGQVLSRALKPGVQYGPDVPTTLNDTMKPIIAASPKIGGLSDYVDAASAAKSNQGQQYQNLIAPYRQPPTGPFRSSAVDGNPIAVAQVNSIPKLDLLERPPNAQGEGGIVNATANLAQHFDRSFTVPELDDYRQGANQKLHAFYAKAGGDQYGALANPETARVKALGDATRDQLYGKLAADNGMSVDDINNMQQMYGKLADVENMAGKREIVYGRHDPVSLAEKVVAGHGGPLATTWNFAVQKGLRGLTDSDALVRSAVDRFQNPDATPLLTGSGLFQRGLAAVGSGLDSTGQAVQAVPVNPLLFAPRKR